MGSYGSFTVPVGNTGNTYTGSVTDLYYCSGEEYIESPQFYSRYKAHSFYGWYMVSNADTMSFPTVTTSWGNRRAISIQYIETDKRIRVWDNPTTGSTTGNVSFAEYSGQSQSGYGAVTPTLQYAQEIPYGVLGPTDWRIDDVAEFEFSTNIPVFATNQQAWDYVRTGNGLAFALNFYIPHYENGKEFLIMNTWVHGTWDNYGQHILSENHYRGVRGRMVNFDGGGKISLYKIDGINDGALKYGVQTSAVFDGLQYTTDGVNWIDTDTFPFDYFYRQHDDELGTFDYALTLDNGLFPIWDNQGDSTDYIQGDKDIDEAPNYPNISNNYPIHNNTGDDDEDNTTMGEVYTRAFFSQQYICSVSAIQQISNALFDISDGGIVGKWENIKKGLEMYGENPMDAVQGCMFFPVDLTQVFTSVSTLPYIYFGGYKFDLADGVTVSKITFPNGHYDYGTFNVSSSFGGTWRDYAPYQRLYCYLPYIGWTELDIARYLDKTVRVWYYFDTRTGMCLACLFTNTATGYVLQDYFNGQCGVSMPITLTDFTNYANTQIKTLLGVGNGQIQNASNIGNMASDLASKGVGASAIATASVGLGAVSVGIGATKTLYGLTQNNINNFNKTKGGSSSMLNMYLPQEVCFMIETQQCDITPNELSLMGFPSNASGKLNDFSGYLEVDTVNLVCPYATETEKAEIVGLLKSGVYI